MKIFIAGSRHLYHKIPEIAKVLTNAGHEVAYPNSFEDPGKENRMKEAGQEEHASWKAEMLKRDKINIAPNDAILVLNLEKHGQANYIGRATFLEIYKAFELGKKIFLYNPIPENIFTDELKGINPIILNGDITKIEHALD